MRRRRNPDALGDVTTLALLGVVGVVGYEVVVNQKTLQQAVQSVVQPVASAVNSVASRVTAAANATGLPGVPQGANNLQHIVTGTVPTASVSGVCADISAWRSSPPKAPGILGLLGLQEPGFDPTDWGQFHDYAIGILGYDPGPTPPACFYAPTYSTSPYGPNS